LDIETRSPWRRPSGEEVRQLVIRLVGTCLNSAVTWLVYELLRQLN
jgi:hypothetical protein